MWHSIHLIRQIVCMRIPDNAIFWVVHVLAFGMDIVVTYGTFSIIFILVTTDVMDDNWCGRFGLWPFRFVAVSVCGRSGLWPFRFVAVSVCGRFCLWPFRLVAVSVCGRSGLWPFRFVAVSVVAVSVCGRYNLLPHILCTYTTSFKCLVPEGAILPSFNLAYNRMWILWSKLPQK